MQAERRELRFKFECNGSVVHCQKGAIKHLDGRWAVRFGYEGNIHEVVFDELPQDPSEAIDVIKTRVVDYINTLQQAGAETEDYAELIGIEVEI